MQIASAVAWIFHGEKSWEAPSSQLLRAVLWIEGSGLKMEGGRKEQRKVGFKWLVNGQGELPNRVRNQKMNGSVHRTLGHFCLSVFVECQNLHGIYTTEAHCVSVHTLCSDKKVRRMPVYFNRSWKMHWTTEVYSRICSSLFGFEKWWQRFWVIITLFNPNVFPGKIMFSYF